MAIHFLAADAMMDWVASTVPREVGHFKSAKEAGKSFLKVPESAGAVRRNGHAIPHGPRSGERFGRAQADDEMERFKSGHGG
jgi:hypothetical protein